MSTISNLKEDGMKYERFEDLPVWKAAIQFAVKVYALTATEQFKGHGTLRDNLERAAVSISNNIAEGFERGTTQELLTFIYIARGSCGESRSELRLVDLLPRFQNLKPDISNLISDSISISKQLRAWANSLQNSDIRGQRYLTDKARRVSQAAREREEFLEELRKMQEERIANLKSSGRN
jgi:four helix bundle protein